MKYKSVNMFKLVAHQNNGKENPKVVTALKTLGFKETIEANRVKDALLQIKKILLQDNNSVKNPLNKRADEMCPRCNSMDIFLARLNGTDIKEANFCPICKTTFPIEIKG